jgi:hypothetical protein
MAGRWLYLSCNGVKLGDRSFGVAVIPLSEQVGWSRATLSAVVLVTDIVSSLFQLMIGVLVDRLGPRYVRGWDRRTYQQAVQYLKRMKAVYKSLNVISDWDAYLQSLRAQYRHLPALQDEMRQARL